MDTDSKLSCVFTLRSNSVVFPFSQSIIAKIKSFDKDYLQVSYYN